VGCGGARDVWTCPREQGRSAGEREAELRLRRELPPPVLAHHTNQSFSPADVTRLPGIDQSGVERSAPALHPQPWLLLEAGAPSSGGGRLARALRCWFPSCRLFLRAPASPQLLSTCQAPWLVAPSLLSPLDGSAVSCPFCPPAGVASSGLPRV
jgi:hypothetical protein